MASDNRNVLEGRELPEIHLSDLERDPEMERLKRASVSERLRLSLVDMRQVTRDLIDEAPSEPRLLFFVLLSDVIFFLNVVLKFVISPENQAAGGGLPEGFGQFIGGALVLAFFLRTFSLYLCSGSFSGVCCVFGGEGSWRDTRAGVFWASLVAAPLGVLGALLVAGLGYLSQFHPIFGAPILLTPAHLLGVVAFVFFVSAAVAEAQRFGRTSPVFIAMSVLTVVIVIGGIAGWNAVENDVLRAMDDVLKDTR